MAEKTATEASNDFWLEFKAEKQAIEDQLAKAKTLPKTELSSHFSNVLQQINSLEKSLTKATEFIPSYDERQFSLQLRELSDTLEQSKAELTPKAKFSFKSRKKKTTATAQVKSASTEVPAAPVTESGAILSEATVLFDNKQDSVLRLRDIKKTASNQKSIDILLSSIKNCVIDLRDKEAQISAVHIKNVKNCIVYCGSIEGSILMYGLKNSVLVAGCHQLRMHEAQDVDLVLHVTSRPIIEDSTKIQVCDWNINASVNYFDQMEDFNWLKKQASPNWKIMDQGRKQALVDSIGRLIESDQDSTQENILSNGLELLPAQ